MTIEGPVHHEHFGADERSRACDASEARDFREKGRKLLDSRGCSRPQFDVRFAIMDETDSGLDIDALRIVAHGVNSMRNAERSFLIITHYQRLLDHITPDFVHVLSAGKIVKSGGPELAHELEEKGYDWIKEGVEA